MKSNKKVKMPAPDSMCPVCTGRTGISYTAVEQSLV